MFSVFLKPIETLTKVWENPKNCGNTCLRLVFPQRFSFSETSTCGSVMQTMALRLSRQTSTCGGAFFVSKFNLGITDKNVNNLQV